MAARSVATATLAARATSAPRSTRLRKWSTLPAPRPIATSRTAAMSIPNRLPAAATKATCTATVTRPNAPGSRAWPRRIWTPRAARTPAIRPTTFTAVPVRSVRSSLTARGCCGFSGVLLEVPEAAQALLHLALLLLAVDADRLRGGRAAPFLVRLEPDSGRDLAGEVCQRDLRALFVGDPGAGHRVDALGPVVAGEPVRRRDEVACTSQAVERGRLQQEVGRSVEIRPGQHLLLAHDTLDRTGARVRILEAEQGLGDLVADKFVGGARHRTVRLTSDEVHGDTLPGGDDARVRPGLRPVERRRGHSDPPVKAELVVDDPRERSDAPPGEEVDERRS